MPHQKKEVTRNVSTTVRLTQEEYDHLKAAAWQERITLSDLFRLGAIEHLMSLGHYDRNPNVDNVDK